MTARAWLLANLATKALAVALARYPLSHPDEPRFKGKALGLRARLYPIAPATIPAIWLARGRPSPYPHATDIAWVAPFAIDSGANVLGLYDRKGFDALAHYANWTCLSAAFGASAAPTTPVRWQAAGLALGFGAFSHVLWEIGEYGMLRGGARALGLSYEDTIRDLVFSLLGSMTGAAITWGVVWPHRRQGHLFGWAPRR